MLFYNGLNHDCHFIIRKLLKESEREFNCLGENNEKCKTFSVPVIIEFKKISKNGEEVTKTISYKLQFIDRARFMASSLSNEPIADNLAEGIHKFKCKYGHDN